MTRTCGGCGAAGKITTHGRGICTMWCTTWGEVRRGDDPGCRFYVRGPARALSEFDVNVNLDVMKKRAEGKMPAFDTPHRPARPVNLNILRARSAQKGRVVA